MFYLNLFHIVLQFLLELLLVSALNILSYICIHSYLYVQYEEVCVTG